MAVAYNYYDQDKKQYVRRNYLQNYQDELHHLLIAEGKQEGILGIAKSVTTHFRNPDVLVVDQINDGDVLRDGIARYFWLMTKDSEIIDVGSLGAGIFVTKGHKFVLSGFEINNQGVVQDFADWDQYAYIQKIDNTRKTSGRCPYCRSLRSESIFHPGTCVNCGGDL